MKKAVVIGSGFAGLSAAACLAQDGVEVHVLEKNAQIGGRARKFEERGFVFDMGPSWYWMPDVFEAFFARFGRSVSDYYELQRLSPSYSIIFGENERLDIPSDPAELPALFESVEKGSAAALEKFLAEAEYKYRVGMEDLVYKPCNSVTEYFDLRLLKGIFQLGVFRSFHSYARKFFRDPRLLSLMEFPVLFLGAQPKSTPALYSLMNYAGLSLGTWYPAGGMWKIIEGMASLAESLGVQIHTGHNVSRISVQDARANFVETDQGRFGADTVVAAADYHHVETSLLSDEYRSYGRKYWDSRVMAPSSLIFYLGIDKKLKGLDHHTLFFDEDFTTHAKEIYEQPQWPSAPLFYVCSPSVTDSSVAPEGMENLFILMPLAAGMEDCATLREKYFGIIMERLERHTKQSIAGHIIVKRSYASSNFRLDYNAFRGNAYGLANTLKQTAFMKPAIRSKKVRNLFYAGQLTVPGPGVPPSLISGQIAANEAIQFLRENRQ